MNYVDQSKAFRRFTFLRLAVQSAFAALAVPLLGYGWARTGTFGLILAVLLSVGALAAMGYLPMYLGLTVERRKKHAWPVRFRTVAVPLLALAAIPLLSTPGRWLAWTACFAVAVIAVLAARRALKRHPDADAIPLLPLELLVGDAAIILIAASQGPGALVPCAAGLAVAVVLFLASSEGRARWYGLALVLVTLACVPGLDGTVPIVAAGVVALPCIAAVGSLILMHLSSKQHDANVAATVDELTAFDTVSPDEAHEMLATATGILARNWNANPPVDAEAVGRWYEANSEYYLYDLAQFHLAYKHIRFMIDIVGMAHGRVLDYGAGIGDLVLELARRGNDVTYLDVDGRTKAFARWRAERDWLPVTFAGSLEEVDGPYDTIISLDVFEHLAEPLPIVDGLVERLAPGGRMVVTAYFGATKSHPMHFDHDIDLGAYLRASGLVDSKSFAMKHLRSQFLGKRGVLIFEKPG